MRTAWRYGGLYGGCTGGHVVVRLVMWWELWEMHGGAADYVLGIQRYAWRYWGHYGGSTGGRGAVLGSSVVGVSGDAWRYWGVPLTP